MSEENKQEKVKVKIQGREFELTKLSKGEYSGKISFKIGDIENEGVDARHPDVDKNGNIRSLSYHIDLPQKISFKIGGIKNEDVYATFLGFDKNGNITRISFHTKSPQKISFKIGDIENRNIEVSEILLSVDYEGSYISEINLLNNQKISFKIGDIENSNIEVSRISLIEDYEGSHIREIIPLNNQKISFKIGDIKNENIEVNMIIFDKNGSPQYILLKEKQKISFKIGDIENSNIEVSEISFRHGGIYTLQLQDAAQIGCYINNKKCMIFITNAFPLKDIIFFPDGRTLKQAMLFEDITLNVKFHGKDYNLPFKNGDEIIFNDNKELSHACIDNSHERSNIVYIERLKAVEAKTEELEEKQNLATKEDWKFVYRSGALGLCCVFGALFGKPICLLLLNWITYEGCITHEGFDKIYEILFLNQESQILFKEHETFNRYTFLYEILKRTPIIILVILGFKFLQLAFERLRLIGKVEQVQKYINLTTDNDTKKQLLKMIAIPFFAPKKVKSSFFDRLIDKTSINIGSERENSGVISEDKQNSG